MKISFPDAKSRCLGTATKIMKNTWTLLVQNNFWNDRIRDVPKCFSFGLEGQSLFPCFPHVQIFIIFHNTKWTLNFLPQVNQVKQSGTVEKTKIQYYNCNQIIKKTILIVFAHEFGPRYQASNCFFRLTEYMNVMPLYYFLYNNVKNSSAFMGRE